jgi:hypothetical protein
MSRKTLFPYPLPETIGIGTVDPRDYRFDVGRQEWVHEPGWWRNIKAGTARLGANGNSFVPVKRRKPQKTRR